MYESVVSAFLIVKKRNFHTLKTSLNAPIKNLKKARHI